MKAYLIDPDRHEITEVDYDPDNQLITDIIGSESGLDYWQVNLMQDTIYVDDDGLFQHKTLFRIRMHNRPGIETVKILAGKGLVLGVDSLGNSIPPTQTINWFRKHIDWPDLEFSHIQTRHGVMDHPVLGKNTPYIEHIPVFVEKKKDD